MRYQSKLWARRFTLCVPVIDVRGKIKVVSCQTVADQYRRGDNSEPTLALLSILFYSVSYRVYKYLSVSFEEGAEFTALLQEKMRSTLS